jgi:hypothetical protein
MIRIVFAAMLDAISVLNGHGRCMNKQHFIILESKNFAELAK